MTAIKLYMLLLGCKPKDRHTEQHDVFFGVATGLKELIPDIKGFWSEGRSNIHIDAWREVTAVDGHRIEVVERESNEAVSGNPKLFFINLGGYQKGIFDEPHYRVLTVQPDKASAFQYSKRTSFYKQIRYKGAESHIDDKYGIDVDDLYQIEDVLPLAHKQKYVIRILDGDPNASDEIHLGYFKLSNL